MRGDMSNKSRFKTFIIEDMLCEYDEEKNETNIKKHGISFEIAASINVNQKVSRPLI